MKTFWFFFICCFCGAGCSVPSSGNADKAENDSLLQAEQKKRIDSLKKKNPLLILPPDSEYTGEYIDRWENGLVKFRGQFRFGKRHGQWVSFYINGQPWSELHYDMGLRHGLYVVYYPGMIKKMEGYYKYDMRDSVWYFYDSTGFKTAEIVFSKNKEIKSLYFKKNNDHKKTKQY